MPTAASAGSAVRDGDDMDLVRHHLLGIPAPVEHREDPRTRRGGASASGAVSITVPTTSVPGMKGSGGRRWYLPSTTSCVAKETPVASMRMRTPRGRIGGGGTSFSSSASKWRQDLADDSAHHSSIRILASAHQAAPSGRIPPAAEGGELRRGIGHRLGTEGRQPRPHLGCRSAAATACCIRSTIGTGVRAGAHIPYQDAIA